MVNIDISGHLRAIWSSRAYSRRFKLYKNQLICKGAIPKIFYLLFESSKGFGEIQGFGEEMQGFAILVKYARFS